MSVHSSDSRIQYGEPMRDVINKLNLHMFVLRKDKVVTTLLPLDCLRYAVGQTGTCIFFFKDSRYLERKKY